VPRIVCGAPSWIRQNVVSSFYHLKFHRIARFGVVRVKARRQKPIDAMDRFAIGVGAYLKEFIVIDHRFAAPPTTFVAL
jgi:hypothetical protein